MKVTKSMQLIVLWPEISAAVPEGSPELERERRAIDVMVGQTGTLHDQVEEHNIELLVQLRALMDEDPECGWPAISGDGVQRRCTLELVPSPAGPCLECVEPVGSGVVGWIGEPEPGPLCDHCLAQASPELGAILGLVTFLREITAADLEDDPEAHTGLMESLLLMTQVYARSCAGAWPSRPKGMREARDTGLERMRQRHGRGWAKPPPDDRRPH